MEAERNKQIGLESWICKHLIFQNYFPENIFALKLAFYETFSSGTLHDKTAIRISTAVHYLRIFKGDSE